jgi:hypothetical protein
MVRVVKICKDLEGDGRMNKIGVGKVYIDKYDAGRIYIPKELMNYVQFNNKEQVLVIVEQDKIIVKKLNEVIKDA